MLKHDPNSHYLTFINELRNVFLLQGFSLAIIGLTPKNSKIQIPIKIIGVCIFIFALISGVRANLQFKKYIDHIAKDESLEETYKQLISYWQQWIVMSWIYLFITFALLIVIFGEFSIIKFQNST